MEYKYLPPKLQNYLIKMTSKLPERQLHLNSDTKHGRKMYSLMLHWERIFLPDMDTAVLTQEYPPLLPSYPIHTYHQVQLHCIA
jgi:hypothetical protein